MYGLRVVTVPTHRPRARVDRPVRVYIQRAGKRRMLYALIQESTWRRQPLLIGTGSVADSEEISGWLHDWCARRGSRPGRAPQRRAAAGSQGVRVGVQGAGAAVSPLPPWLPPPGTQRAGSAARATAAQKGAAGGRRGRGARARRQVPHQLLNARPALVAREAAVIAQAGLPGRVTIATSMAGRGTDILLGGNPKGLAAAALEDLALPFLALGAPAGGCTAALFCRSARYSRDWRGTCSAVTAALRVSPRWAAGRQKCWQAATGLRALLRACAAPGRRGRARVRGGAARGQRRAVARVPQRGGHAAAPAAAAAGRARPGQGARPPPPGSIKSLAADARRCLRCMASCRVHCRALSPSASGAGCGDAQRDRCARRRRCWRRARWTGCRRRPRAPRWPRP